jgi:hypothetical protein
MIKLQLNDMAPHPEGHGSVLTLTLSNPIFLPTAYCPALIYCGRERGWWITCWLKSVLHEEKCRTGSYSGAGEQTQKKVLDRLLQQSGRTNEKKSVGRHLTSEQNGKIMSDKVRRRIGKG